MFLNYTHVIIFKAECENLRCMLQLLEPLRLAQNQKARNQ